MKMSGSAYAAVLSTSADKCYIEKYDTRIYIN
jgi:hypothetical protein